MQVQFLRMSADDAQFEGLEDDDVPMMTTLLRVSTVTPPPSLALPLSHPSRHSLSHTHFLPLPSPSLSPSLSLSLSLSHPSRSHTHTFSLFPLPLCLSHSGERGVGWTRGLAHGGGGGAGLTPAGRETRDTPEGKPVSSTTSQ
jgi:hypothetical protein